MSTSVLNQSAPPAEAPQSKDFVKLEVFPKSDSYVLTVAGFNFIASHPFKRRDDKTGEEYTKNGPALELYFGTILTDDKGSRRAYFVKTWPQAYSLNEKANYYKWYEAATGKAPVAGTKPDDMLGKAILGDVRVEDKKSLKGTAYRVSSLKSIGKVPSILAATIVPLKDLQGPFNEALAAEQKDPY